MKLFKKKYSWASLIEKMIAQPEVFDYEYAKIEKKKPHLAYMLHNLRHLLNFMYIRRAYFEDVIDKVNFQAMQYALHNYNIKTELTRKDDFFDSLITSINLLGEELNYSTITRQYLNDVFNSIPDFLFVLDNHGFIQSLNRYALDQLLYSEEEMKFASICSYIDEACNFDNLKEFSENNRVVHLKTKNNQLIPVSIKSAQFIRGNQNESGWIYVFSNVTRLLNYQKELEEALQKAHESDKLKSAFLANISHEIRTPLNGILGFSEVLMSKEFSKEQQIKYLNIIQTNGKRLLSTIEDLIEISRIESGNVKVLYQRVNINQLMTELYQFFKPEADAKNLQFSMQLALENDKAVISADKTKLNSIIINLVKNALKYTDKGSIVFGYEIENAFIKIFVKDTGIGIPADRQEAVFDRFVQADLSDREARQGTGLGLSIVKSYVEMLKGSISLQSEVGSGTTFYVRLPFLPSFQQDENQPFVEKALDSLKNQKVLIVEDNESSAALLKYMFLQYTQQILFAGNGLEAIRLCKEHPDISLIMMDIKMPEMDGLTATREIRKFNQQVIIIAQTAFAMNGDDTKAIEAGCNDFLKKPILREEFNAILSKYF